MKPDWQRRAADQGRRTDDWFGRRRLWWLWALGVLFFTTATLRARATPFWHDEIYTVLLSRLPSVHDIWRAARDGTDLCPPLNLYLTRFVEDVAGVGSVSSRVVPMLGFWTMSLAVFRMVRVRSNAVLGLCAALVPWFTAAYRYGYEARGYGLMLGLFSVLLLSWSDAARGRRRRLMIPVFAIACAATIWNHYFGAATIAVIVAAEIARTLQYRRADWALWAAGAVGAAACAPLIVLMRGASRQNAFFWHHAAWSDVGATYAALFRDVPAVMIWPLAVALAFGVARLARRRSGASWIERSIPGYEIVAGAIALAIPVLDVWLGRHTGIYVPRYALPVVVGASVTGPLVLSAMGGRHKVADACLLLLLGLGVVSPSLDLLRTGLAYDDPVSRRPLLRQELDGPAPIVVGGSIQFLPLWYYAPAAVASHLWYVADPALDVAYTGTDTTDRGYLALARWVPLPLHSYQDLVELHQFEVYDNGSGWLMARLRDAGAIIGMTQTERGSQLLDVTLPQAAARR